MGQAGLLLFFVILGVVLSLSETISCLTEFNFPCSLCQALHQIQTEIGKMNGLCSGIFTLRTFKEQSKGTQWVFGKAHNTYTEMTSVLSGICEKQSILDLAGPIVFWYKVCLGGTQAWRSPQVLCKPCRVAISLWQVEHLGQGLRLQHKLGNTRQTA